MRSSLLLGAAFGALAALAVLPGDARACGGTFLDSESTTVIVKAHRMAFSISQTQSVLWDQIAYTGSPKGFAWVLPVRPGAVIEVSNDAWFDTLDAATSVNVVTPAQECDSGGDDFTTTKGCGCGSTEEADFGGSASSGDEGHGSNPVTVVHQGTIGPYETVTLHSDVPGALTDWLTSHGYPIDPGIQPIIDAYEAEGMDFIALRLSPQAGVKQMKPVRVVTPGAGATLPLRMVAAGTGAGVDVTLFVLGEGRWEAESFPNATVAAKDVSWDFDKDAASASNYTTLRAKALAGDGGKTWLTSFSKQGALLGRVNNPTGFGGPVIYSTGAAQETSIAAFYAATGGADEACQEKLEALASSTDQVVDNCSPATGGGTGGGGTGGSGGGAGGTGGTFGATGSGGAGGGETCATLPPSSVSASDLTCGALDDVGVALTGMHPADVWVTRLEASLPRSALATDLTLQASADQSTVENYITPGKLLHSPCATSSATVSRSIWPGPRNGPRNGPLAMSFAAMVALAAAVGRRTLRRRPHLSPARS